MKSNRILDYIERINEIKEMDQLVKFIEALGAESGFDGFFFGGTGMLDLNLAPALTNYPAEWLQRYTDAELYLNDPVHIFSMAAIRPFLWPEAAARLSDRDLPGHVLEQASEHGLLSGYVVPLLKIEQNTVAISFSTDHPNDLAPDHTNIDIACRYLYATARSIAQNPSAPENIHLTPRERECLHWVANGKSDWEIAGILSITQRTAHAHVENAKTKLNCVTRAQAVLEALRHGFLNL